jgi:hypothetical protein
MGLGLGDFLDLTPFEWIGIKARFIEYREKADRERWELARWKVFRTACPPQPKTAGGLLSPRDFILFPWELEDKPAERTSEEKFKAAIERYK